MDEEITTTRRVIILIALIGVIIGFLFLGYTFYLKELTWKQTVNDFVSLRMQWEDSESEVRNEYGHVIGKIKKDYAGELILLLNESGFETYRVKALALKGFCTVVLDENVYALSNELKLKIFNECLISVDYVKVIAFDGNYIIEPITGEYAPKDLAKGERKVIVVKE